VTALPTGTVALLFSDIEGSTVLLARLGPAYVEALDAQRRLLRQAWATHGGTELGTEGDSFFSGRVHEAKLQAEALVDPVLQLRSPILTIAFAHTYMDVLLRTGDLERGAMLYGAEASMRERLAMPNPHEEEELQDILALVGESVSADDWEELSRAGRGRTVEGLLSDFRQSRSSAPAARA
jgi:hypothetical protein